jgi:NADPH2:quinone reductase
LRALVCRALGDDLSEVVVQHGLDVPTPGPGEVLVRVEAASANFPDLLMCQGKYQFRPPLPFVPGMDVAGRIAALGPGVTAWSVDDAVFGGARLGAFADWCVCPASGLMRRPDHLSAFEAACLPAATLTAWVTLVRRAHLQPGETVLVHGATGGVGLATADLARHLGARVIATASSAAKRDVLHQRGFDHVLASSGFRDAVKDLTQGRGADVVVDPVGGAVFDESVRCIAFDGRLMVVGFASGVIPTIAANMPLIKGFAVIGVRAGEYGRQFPGRGRENIKAIEELAQAGHLRPLVWKTFSLEHARDALVALRDRAVVGKAVIVMDELAP